MNKRKYTTLKKRSIISLILVSSLFVCGCSNEQTLPVAIPVPPTKTESVIPYFKKIGNGIDEGIQANMKIDTKLKEQKDTVLKQRIIIEETIAKVKSLREKILADQLIKELDAIEILNDIEGIQSRNLFLERQNSELYNIRVELDGILKLTKEDASITFQKLIIKEDEVNNLRIQNKFLSNNLVIKNNEVQELLKNLEKEKIKSAKSSVYRNWVIGLASGFILWLIIKNVIMLYFPMTRFRI